jgi:outer membrane receptor for ferric coprogen and ferric-rhodotorulic acid
MNKRGGMKGLLCMWAVTLAWTCGSTQLGDDEGMKYRLHIASGPLDQSLQELAAQSGIQIVFFSKLTEGRRAPALDGLYTITSALDILLANSKLGYRMINPKTIQISPTASLDNSKEAPTRQEASQAGDNSKVSDDLKEVTVMATAEHLVATRIETPLSAIPQTITIVSAEQIRQQSDTDLTDALRYAPGITVVQVDSMNATFYSRGFQITSFHIDGGAPLSSFFSSGNTTPIFQSSPDLSEFDHIEVLRGSDALFGGTGNPGGTVSLVRKRPLNTFAVSADLSSGSWSNERAEADLTGPLAFDGGLRGRIDAVFEDRGYFYDLATLERKRLFGVIEADVTPTTMVTLGGSYQRDDALPFISGLPRAPDGSDPHLPVDTSLTFDWSRYRQRLREGYLQVQQNFLGDWRLKVDAEQWDGRANAYYGYWSSPIDPVNRELYEPPQSLLNFDDSLHRQFAVDATVTGTFPWFGRRAEVAFGGDFMHVHTTDPVENYFSNFAPPAPTFPFNPSRYPSPLLGSDLLEVNLSGYLRTHGVFASLRMPLTEALSVTAGTRLGSDETRAGVVVSDPGASEPLSARYGSSNVFTPYAGVMYALSDHYSVYASYADIYQTMAEAQQEPSGRLLGPESGVDRELGIKAAWREHTLNGALVFYRITQDSVPLELPFSRQSTLYCCYLPGANRSYGADIEMNGVPAPGWLVTLGYSYNVNQAATGGAISPTTPRHLLKLWTSKQLGGVLDRLTVGGGLLAQSTNSSGAYCSPFGGCPLSTSDSYEVFREIIQGSFAVVNLRAGVRIDSHWQAALTVNNLFDRTYYQALGDLNGGNWYGDPRNWQVRIQGKY